MEFIGAAQKLREIHIHDGYLDISNKFVEDIVVVLRSRDPTEPLKLFVDDKDKIDSGAINCLSNKKYLFVNNHCSRYRH